MKRTVANGRPDTSSVVGKAPANAKPDSAKPDKGKASPNPLRALIKERFGTQADFAQATGLSPNTVSSVIERGLNNTNTQTFKVFVEALGLDLKAALDGRVVMESDSDAAFIPLYGNVSAGIPAEPDLYEEHFPIPAKWHRLHPNAFLLRVDGNSMNLVYPDKSLVMVEPYDGTCISGERYVVAVGQEAATLKQVILHDRGFTLHPESSDPSYQDVFFAYGEPRTATVTVIGKVLGAWHHMDTTFVAALAGTSHYSK